MSQSTYRLKLNDTLLGSSEEMAELVVSMFRLAGKSVIKESHSSPDWAGWVIKDRITQEVVAEVSHASSK